jgi:hypothetical protein
MIFPSLIGSCFPTLEVFVGVPGALADNPFEEVDAVASEMKDEYERGLPN